MKRMVQPLTSVVLARALMQRVNLYPVLASHLLVLVKDKLLLAQVMQLITMLCLWLAAVMLLLRTAQLQ
jgi:hypothetical protein